MARPGFSSADLAIGVLRPASAPSAVVMIDAGGGASSIERTRDALVAAASRPSPELVSLDAPRVRRSHVLTPLLAAIGVMAPAIDRPVRAASSRLASDRDFERMLGGVAVVRSEPIENPPGSTPPELREARRDRRARAMARRARRGRR